MYPKDTIRLLTLGDSGAGKSSLILHYTQEIFSYEHAPTIGIDFRSKTVTIDNKTINIQLWDTAGQERFRTVTQNYYRGADGIALVFDLTDWHSFRNIHSWVKSTSTHADEDVVLVLLGNKSDLEEQRVVPKEECEALAQEFNIPYFETSAKLDINVDEAFSYLVEEIISNRSSLEKQNNVSHDNTKESLCVSLPDMFIRKKRNKINVILKNCF